MNDILLVAGLFIIFYINEKYRLINFSNIKNIITNIIFVLPIISIYFNQENIIDFYNKTKTKSINNSNKRRVTELTKKTIASNQQWKCNICNNILDASYEIDHIIPLYKGGTNDIYNLQALCRNCHGKKTIEDSLIK
jgi:hypothetical protein